jgi:hypothetical protein
LNHIRAKPGIPPDSKKSGHALGEWFIYWGEKAPVIPSEFAEFVHKGIGNHYVDNEDRIIAFLKWATPLGEPGVNGDPVEWKYPAPKRRKVGRGRSFPLSAPNV